MLYVRKSTPGDSGRIAEIYRAAQEFMIASGNPTQWGHTYPSADDIEADINLSQSFLVCNDSGAHGVFVLCSGEEPTYRIIENGGWLDNDPYVTIHRIGSDGSVHGIFDCLLDHCEKLSQNIRIDTHENNLPMRRLMDKHGFKRCGIIYVRDGSPRIAYQRHKR